MEELTAKLHELGIENKYTINKISKLIKQHEDRKSKSKAVYANKPVNYELTAKMIWAKNHKALCDQYKIALGAEPIITIKTVNKQQIETVKYKVPQNKQQDYSNWLLYQIQKDPNFVNFEQVTHSKSGMQEKLNYIIDYLQTQNPPRYLTGEMKTYIKKMIIKGDTDQQIFGYITEIQAKIPYGTIDPNTRKIQHKQKDILPPPAGVTVITKPVRPSSPKQLIKPVKPKIPIPFSSTQVQQQQIQQQQVMQPQVMQPQTNAQNSLFTILQPLSPTYKSPVQVPTVSSPKVNMQI